MPDLTGQILKGRYRVESLLGRGGMAEVYKAWDTWRNYHVAVKVMREDLAEDLEFLRRFRREATALAKLAHENIVRFYAFEQDDLTAFIVMDYVEGTTLRAEIARADGPLPMERALAITRQVGAALNYAHLEGVIHRDVKPGNIMLRPDGRVLLSDFGISKAMDAATATATTVSVGTPAYMSPEQCAGQTPDGRTDVYSLGVVVYEMLAGRRPFVGDLAPETITNTTERIRWEQMHASPPALRKLNPAVPREVEAAVMTALAKDREQRWPTVAAFGEALTAASESGRVGERGSRGAEEQGGGGAGGQRGRGAGETKVVSPPRAVIRSTAAQEARPAARAFSLRDVPWPIWVVGGGLVVVLIVLGIALATGKGGGRVTPTVPVVAQAVATPTPTPSPTQTLVPGGVPAPIVIITPVPTDTPVPSPTPTATTTPTSAPTLAVTAVPISPSPTPTARPTVAPTESLPTKPPPGYPAPVLLSPQANADVSRQVIFTWNWPGPTLADNQGFEVRIWKEGQPDHYGAAEPVQTTSATIDVRGAYGVQVGGSGAYFWTVALVERTPSYKRIGPEATPRPLIIATDGSGQPTPPPVSPAMVEPQTHRAWYAQFGLILGAAGVMVLALYRARLQRP